jgi:hypothetical protein
MSDQAVETMWKIVLALFNVVLLPVLLMLLKPFIEDLVNRWKFRRTRAVSLRGRYSDDRGFVYNMTAFLYLARCEHLGDDYEVKGMIESELLEFPEDFARNHPTYPAGSTAFEVVAGRCESRLVNRRRCFVLIFSTVAITNPILVSRCSYHITIPDGGGEFEAVLAILPNCVPAMWTGTAQVR